jgi:hypothetical protein
MLPPRVQLHNMMSVCVNVALQVARTNILHIMVACVAATCSCACMFDSCTCVLQVLYMSCCGMLWTSYLSYISS